MRDPREVARGERVLPRGHRGDELEKLRAVAPAALVERGRERDERMREKAVVDARREEPARVLEAARHERERRRERVDRALDRRARRVNEDEAPHETRVPAREDERDRAAERMAEQVHAFRRIRQRLDPADDDLREEPDPVDDARPGGLVARAVPEEVERQNAPSAREPRKRERPLAVIRADPVQEGERRGPAGARRARVEARDGKASGDVKTPQPHLRLNTSS